MISTENVKATRARLAQLRSVLFTAAFLAFGVFAVYAVAIDGNPLGEVVQFAIAGLAVAVLVI